MEIKELVHNGFLIYIEGNNFVVEKRPTSVNRSSIDKRSFETIEEAISFVKERIFEKRWKAIIRYNRGLGVEYKTIEGLLAGSYEDAKSKALIEAENALGDYIIEIKVTENF